MSKTKITKDNLQFERRAAAVYLRTLLPGISRKVHREFLEETGVMPEPEVYPTQKEWYWVLRYLQVEETPLPLWLKWHNFYNSLFNGQAEWLRDELTGASAEVEDPELPEDYVPLSDDEAISRLTAFWDRYASVLTVGTSVVYGLLHTDYAESIEWIRRGFLVPAYTAQEEFYDKEVTARYYCLRDVLDAVADVDRVRGWREAKKRAKSVKASKEATAALARLEVRWDDEEEVNSVYATYLADTLTDAGKREWRQCRGTVGDVAFIAGVNGLKGKFVFGNISPLTPAAAGIDKERVNLALTHYLVNRSPFTLPKDDLGCREKLERELRRAMAELLTLTPEQLVERLSWQQCLEPDVLAVVGALKRAVVEGLGATQLKTAYF